jgi:hypothetical protein
MALLGMNNTLISKPIGNNMEKVDGARRDMEFVACQQKASEQKAEKNVMLDIMLDEDLLQMPVIKMERSGP